MDAGKEVRHLEEDPFAQPSRPGPQPGQGDLVISHPFLNC